MYRQLLSEIDDQHWVFALAASSRQIGHGSPARCGAARKPKSSYSLRRYTGFTVYGKSPCLRENLALYFLQVVSIRETAV